MEDEFDLEDCEDEDDDNECDSDYSEDSAGGKDSLKHFEDC